MDYTTYLPGLLLLCGGLLQWLRAAKKFAEYWYVAVAAALALGCYFLTANYHQEWRLIVIAGLAGLRENIIAVLAGTQAVSTLANLAAKAVGSAASFAIPQTNSK